jgi:hypothetical protein
VNRAAVAANTVLNIFVYLYLLAEWLPADGKNLDLVLVIIPNAKQKVKYL